MTSDGYDFSTIRVERNGGLLEATLDRPPLNAVNDALHHDLVALMQALKVETEAGAVLLTGAGRAFSAGGDYAWLAEQRGAAALDALRKQAKQIIWDLLDIEVPLVAAINGPAVGLGASIALLCDTIFIADDAVIADPHVRVGIVAGDGGVAAWPLAVGPARAKQYLMTGDAVPAREAERIGLVNEVVAPSELLARAREFALRLAEGAPLAVRYTKMSVNKLIKDALNSAFDTSTALEMLTFASRDHEEAVAALQEKRPARFEGR